MSINCGIDWAEAHHDVALVDENGTVVARKRIDTGTAGLTALLEVIAESGGARKQCPAACVVRSGRNRCPGNTGPSGASPSYRSLLVPATWAPSTG